MKNENETKERKKEDGEERGCLFGRSGNDNDKQKQNSGKQRKRCENTFLNWNAQGGDILRRHTKPSLRNNVPQRKRKRNNKERRERTMSSGGSDAAKKKEGLVLKLHEIGAIKFGTFTLKSGIESPVYVDLRVLVSHPEVLENVADALLEAVQDVHYDVLCGVPYTGQQKVRKCRVIPLSVGSSTPPLCVYKGW